MSSHNPRPKRSRKSSQHARRRGRPTNKTRRRSGLAFTPEATTRLRLVFDMLRRVSPDLGKWLSVNLAIATVAILQLWQGARGGNGWVTLCAISRAMPLELNEKMRQKRLARLLANKRLNGTELTPLLVRLALGERPPPWVHLVVDQTELQGVQAILVGILVAHRVMPVAFATFEYSKIRKSQNATESALLKLVASCMPSGTKPVFVCDRGYARAALFEELNALRIPYLIRGRRNVAIEHAGNRSLLGSIVLKHREPLHMTDVRYQGKAKVPVEIIGYHDPSFKEPWYLIVPEHSAEVLGGPKEIVDLYRARMHIELTFRDWKTHLGLRRLKLIVDPEIRVGRLLLMLAMAYIIAVLLGSGPTTRDVRAHCEVLRTTPRHGTRHRLSALSIGILLLSLPRFARRAARALARVIAGLQRGLGALALAVLPPVPG